jgi:hypothetical protein
MVNSKSQQWSPMLGNAAPDLVAAEPAKWLAWLFTFADSDAHGDSIHNEHLSSLL